MTNLVVSTISDLRSGRQTWRVFIAASIPSSLSALMLVVASQ